MSGLENGDIWHSKTRNYFLGRDRCPHKCEINNGSIIELTPEKLPMSPYFPMWWVICPHFSKISAEHCAYQQHTTQFWYQLMMYAWTKPCTMKPSTTDPSHFNISNLDLYLLSGKTSYQQNMWSFKAMRLDVIMIISLWYLTGISAVLLPKCLSNFKAIGNGLNRISRLQDFTRSCGKTSYRLVNRGPEQQNQPMQYQKESD